jgi:hypothetical protein
VAVATGGVPRGCLGAQQLKGRQLFQIYLGFWIEQLNLAVAEEKRARTKVWSVDKVAYAKNAALFQEDGMRSALGRRPLTSSTP